MNKQEAIEQLEWNVVRTTDFDRAEDVVVFEKAKEIISQIHEPQQVVVPKFVAEYIERCKQSGWHLQLDIRLRSRAGASVCCDRWQQALFERV
ncbi:hypothetical protein ACYKJ6_04775 [Streptococcus suis]